jgi:hypothetical protein
MDEAQTRRLLSAIETLHREGLEVYEHHLSDGARLLAIWPSVERRARARTRARSKRRRRPSGR